MRYASIIIAAIFIVQTGIDVMISASLDGLSNFNWIPTYSRIVIMAYVFGVICLSMLVSNRSSSLLSLGFTRQDIQKSYLLNTALFCLVYTVVSCLVGYSSIYLIDGMAEFLAGFPMYKTFLIIFIVSFAFLTYVTYVASTFMRHSKFYVFLFHSAYMLVLIVVCTRFIRPIISFIGSNITISLAMCFVVGIGFLISTYLSIGRYEVRN